MSEVIRVSGENNYPVEISAGVIARVPDFIPVDAQKALIIHQPGPVAGIAESIRELLSPRVTTELVAVPDGEAAKTVELVASIWDRLAESSFNRNDVIIGVGGGAVTDLAGFIAATWLRGVALIQVPTSLLAMVDAAIGGKTGINIAAGKNLVGSFYAPLAVIADTNTLVSLPGDDLRSGFAEVAKAGFLGAEGIVEPALLTPELLLKPGTTENLTAIRSAAVYKAKVVSSDFREAAGREFLNYGHTMGHAIEHANRYRGKHGQAVAVGMVFAAELARLAGICDASSVVTQRQALAVLGLPVTVTGFGWSELRAAMSIDKKTRGGSLRFVVLRELGRPEILSNPDETLLTAAFAAIQG